jgi:hypothetical protein
MFLAPIIYQVYNLIVLSKNNFIGEKTAKIIRLPNFTIYFLKNIFFFF